MSARTVIDFTESSKIAQIATVKHEIPGPKRPPPKQDPSNVTNVVTQVKQTCREKEELAILQPARKKPASVEAERIYSVVDLTLQKIEVINVLANDHAG